jgi:hypothetical protein
MRSFFTILALAFFASTALAAEPVPGDLLLDEIFDGDTLVKGWLVQTGEWKPAGGVLRGKELEADNHAAAARRLLPMQDGTFELRFRLTGPSPRGFHFGFDPAPGELKKRGHLFSIVVSPTGAKLLKHIDKDRPKEDPNETLANSDTAIAKDVWHTLRLEKKGDSVKASIVAEGGATSISLAATHPTFHVKTPTLVFRCLGDGVEVDDVKVWGKKASQTPKS